MRCFLEAGFGAVALAVAACSSTSAPIDPVDAGNADGSAGAPDAGIGDAVADVGATDAPEAGATEIVLHAASFAIADGASLTCGPDFDGVVVFYAGSGNPTPTETGIVPCATPVVLAPVDPGSTYQLDVYLQKGATVIAQSTCSAVTRAGEAVEATCPAFM